MTSPAEAHPRGPRRYNRWDLAMDRIVEFPWGVLLAVIGVVVLIRWPEKVDQATGLLTAAGLFGIGHGIHRSRR